jgi:hypothetical protein
MPLYVFDVKKADGRKIPDPIGVLPAPTLAATDEIIRITTDSDEYFESVRSKFEQEGLSFTLVMKVD